MVRDKMYNLFEEVGIELPQRIINSLEVEVEQLHRGILTNRNRPWKVFFSKPDFKTLVRDLMMEGSRRGPSPHPAGYVLEPNKVISNVCEY